MPHLKELSANHKDDLVIIGVHTANGADKMPAYVAEQEITYPIAIDTDAHAPGQLEWQNFGCDKAARHGIEATDIVNTRTADDLLAWTSSHAA